MKKTKPARKRVGRARLRLGHVTEVAFALKATQFGLTVCKPLGDSHPFDWVVLHGAKLSRVQVKASTSLCACSHMYAVPTRCFRRGVPGPYSERDIDFIAAYIVPDDTWYILPPRAFRRRHAIAVPQAHKNSRSKYRFYRERWDQFLEKPLPGRLPRIHAAAQSAPQGAFTRYSSLTPHRDAPDEPLWLVGEASTEVAPGFSPGSPRAEVRGKKQRPLPLAAAVPLRNAGSDFGHTPPGQFPCCCPTPKPIIGAIPSSQNDSTAGRMTMVPLRFLRRFLRVLGTAVALLLLGTAAVVYVLAGDPELRTLALLFAASTLLIVILLAIAVYMLSGTLSTRLRRLLAAMEGVRRGEYPLLKVEAEDEFGDLSRGFNHMIEELRARDQRLEQWSSAQVQTAASAALPTVPSAERERLGSALDTGGEGVVVLDADRKVVMAGWRVCEVLGVPMEALIGRDVSAMLAQVRTRLKEPQLADQMLEQYRANPDMMSEMSLELSDPPAQIIKFYCAPVRGGYAAMVGRIAAALDAGRQRETERLKSEFLATISHELRTPLTSVKGSLGLVRGGAAGPISAEMRELLEIAQANTDRLIQVINDILDIVQLERGQASMHIEPMRLSTAVADAMQVMAKEASRKRITLQSQVSDDLPAVRGDVRRVTQVLMNLLSNGIKFSPPGQNVVVRAHPDNGNVIVTVQDFGRGMSREFLGRLFHKFEHAQGSLTRDSQGVGLGLAICRHIVDSHGGAIWAESEPEKGSSFHFSLPVVQAVPAPPWSGEPELPAGHEPRLILVIDDDPDVARVISYVLQTQGHRVITAYSGREGLELARKHSPDMITLDLIMDDLDGYAVLRMLREAEATSRIPIICISVQPDPSRALAQGADFYLEKPVDIEKLRTLAQRALAVA